MPPKRGRSAGSPPEKCRFFDLAPGQGDRALALLGHCWLVYRFLGGASRYFVCLAFPSTPGENQPETCPEGLAFLPLLFVSCLGGKNILNVLFIACVDVCVGLGR